VGKRIKEERKGVKEEQRTISFSSPHLSQLERWVLLGGNLHSWERWAVEAWKVRVGLGL
jgi:hypothetical protein